MAQSRFRQAHVVVGVLVVVAWSACGGRVDVAPCQSEEQCDDRDPCTVDGCDQSIGCMHDPIPGCGKPDASIDASTGGKSGAGGATGGAGHGGADKGGSGGKGGAGGTGGKGGTGGTGGYAGYAGYGDGGCSGSSGSSGCGYAPGSPYELRGWPDSYSLDCSPNQVFIFGTCFP